VIVGREYLGAEFLTTIRSKDGQEYIVSNYIKDERFIQQAGQPIYLNIPSMLVKSSDLQQLLSILAHERDGFFE
jgi:hypothetical protein